LPEVRNLEQAVVVEQEFFQVQEVPEMVAETVALAATLLAVPVPLVVRAVSVIMVVAVVVQVYLV
jgi:hypothetical protein